MKKLYFLFLTAFVTFTSSAAIQNVLITSNNFTPANFTINIGDTVRWFLETGTHNVTGTSIPGGAVAISSGTMATLDQMYEYKVTVAGSYTYRCTFHSGMNGAFTVVDPTAAITKVQKSSSEVKAFPNPFKSKITINHENADRIEICTLLGETVRVVSIPESEKSTVLDLADLKKGVYFYVIKNNNEILETRRIVKSE